MRTQQGRLSQYVSVFYKGHDLRVEELKGVTAVPRAMATCKVVTGQVASNASHHNMASAPRRIEGEVELVILYPSWCRRRCASLSTVIISLTWLVRTQAHHLDITPKVIGDGLGYGGLLGHA